MSIQFKSHFKYEDSLFPSIKFKNLLRAIFLQEAVAIVLESELKRLGLPSSYFNELRSELVEKRNFLAECLQKIGMKVVVPQGGYFLIADWSPLGKFYSLDIFCYKAMFIIYYLFDQFQNTKLI